MTISYPDVENVLAIHERIVQEGDHTEPGVAKRGDVVYALEAVESGHYGQAPETIHEKAAHLMRLLVANHPFVDGNKRTALATVLIFYGLNGYDFDYDDEARAILKDFAIDERAVEIDRVVSYLDSRTEHASETGDLEDALGAVDTGTGNDRNETQRNEFTDEGPTE